MTSRDDPTRKTQRLTEIASGYKSAGTFIGAIETGLFTVISEGAATVEAIAGKLQLPVETTDRLVIGCKALDLIVESDGVIRNQDDVERYMVRTSRTYFGDFLAYEFDRQYTEWESLSQRLRGSGRAKQESFYLGLMQDATEARKFTVAGYESAISLAYLLAKQFNFSAHRKWLDFAGGSGCTQ